MGADADPVLSVARAENIRFMTATSILVVSLTILIYDWLLLLGDELDFIWKTSSITAKILYLSIRYPTFIDTSLTMVYYFRQHLTTERCLAYDVPSIYILSLGTACTERKYPCQLTLYVLLTVCISRADLEDIHLMESVAEDPDKLADNVDHLGLRKPLSSDQSIPGVPGCILLNGDPIIFTCYATLLVVEIIIIILTLIKGFRDFRNSQSALVKTLYRDGIVFFIVVTSMSSSLVYELCLDQRTGTSLGNVLTLLIAPIEYTDLLDS
ncbi:hypothetical protein NM688_g8143 [Phlebia brevispora]|uniref:Uncharacterized protein n=1 Tax=Phlebia brevispora TaxID=194682 RepID=A0ACC1RWR1_9APHY|nr:hypothetical protein NM688_g8143 [Phlebia brevispora]